MDFKKLTWNGYELLEFELMGRLARLVLPKERAEGGPWLLKTEYFNAFPTLELAMLERGWHVAFITNQTRWHVDADDEAKAALAEFLEKEFSLAPKCIPVGMSCGGMHAIYFAASHPERVSAMYIDAPVVNLLSAPCCVGERTMLDAYDEFVKATGMTVSDLINYRNHPYDRLPEIIAANIPIFMVYGDCDSMVPYKENAKPLYDYMTSHGGNITQIIKPGCDHHPHGLDDPTPLIEFVEKYRS